MRVLVSWWACLSFGNHVCMAEGSGVARRRVKVLKDAQGAGGNSPKLDT